MVRFYGPFLPRPLRTFSRNTGRGKELTLPFFSLALEPVLSAREGEAFCLLPPRGGLKKGSIMRGGGQRRCADSVFLHHGLSESKSLFFCGGASDLSIKLSPFFDVRGRCFFLLQKKQLKIISVATLGRDRQGRLIVS